MRRFLCLFLLVILPLQILAAEAGMPASALAHAPGHVQGTSHHHDDDGSVHYDDSDESIQHAQDHSACQPNFALPSVTIASLNFVRSTAVPALPGNVPSEVFLERPQRPPAVPG